MPQLFLAEWKSIDHEQRCDLSRKMLDDPDLACGASIGITLDSHCFGRLWTICCQYTTETYIEQICFAENPNPKYYGPELPPYCRQYDHHWSLRIAGSYGQRFMKAIRKTRAHEAQGEPVKREDYLDGGVADIIVFDPLHVSFSCRVFTDAVYTSGAEGVKIESALHRLCTRSYNSFYRRAFIASLASMLTPNRNRTSG